MKQDVRPLNNFFEFKRIDDGPKLVDSFALRYQVYCKERQFIDEAQVSEGREADRFDDFALHFGAVDNDDQLVGTIRLVRPSEHSLPLFQHCQVDNDDDKITPEKTDVGEISRLAVSRQYRQRRADGPFGHPLTRPAERRRSSMRSHDLSDRRINRPEIVLGLYRALYQDSKRIGIRLWYAAMERSLVRLLQRAGIHFTQIGPEADYFGEVAPYRTTVEEFEKGFFATNPHLLKEFTAGLEAPFLPPIARDRFATAS